MSSGMLSIKFMPTVENIFSSLIHFRTGRSTDRMIYIIMGVSGCGKYVYSLFMLHI